MIPTRRSALAAGAAGLLAAPAIASAQTPLRWRMVTSWPKTLPGPSFSAQRIADRIRNLSGGRIEVQVFAAGEVVPAFAVHEAVGNRTVELGHSASFFAIGREPALAFFTTVPFGLTPPEHNAWVLKGGGQALWDAASERFGVKPLLGGNTGVSMGGWFRREIQSAEDVKGLTIRMVGLGAELFQRLGATAIAVPPGDIYPALERGAVDGAEFTAPGSDIQLGLWRVAPFYYAPGFNKPNGSSELVINKALWDGLPADLKAIVEVASEAEQAVALAEIEVLNMEALTTLVGIHGVKLRGFPAALVQQARRQAADLQRDLSTRSPMAGRVAESYAAFQARIAPWTRVSTHAALGAREV
ncbi:TRAP transporter substrate-binding protein DctP [Phreatobacter sp.]|uniref:TRAP transporter substrate-binding protein n=1 Tax=Phreatobacter sp. TaxID=1966341 RepID=UPI0022C997E1|nr:TRAP transporter substrate-binding protein DctP [Phreatobacter sp.]MCZ8314543.1 TRAP transporter substrate-binding protein DctP [Phreatobacter sp.]